MDGRTKTAVVIAAVLAVLLVATGVLAVVRTSQLRGAEARQDDLERKLAAAGQRIDELTASEDGSGEGPGSSDGLQLPEGLEEGLGEDGLEQLGELFGDLFGDGGNGLGDITGMAEIAQCIQETKQLDIDDDDGESQLDAIEQAVAGLRGLEFTDPVEPSYLPPPEVSERIAESIEEEYSAEEADLDRRYLAALGAIAPDLDLRQTQQDLVSAQVAGFYDSETGEMVIGASDPQSVLNATDQVTLAHELNHALTDQALGFPELLDEEMPDTDAALAALALVEGDATLLMQRFALGALDPGEQLGMALDPRASAAQEQLQHYPHVLRQQLTFPYEQGLRFACALEQEGGWDAINAAYDEVPSTSAQILFPDRYGEPAPSAPAELGSPGPAWTQARTDTLGAVELKWLLEAPGDDPEAGLSDPLQRVAHWDGSLATLWVDGDATALGVALRDGGGPGPSLCDSVTDWYEAAFDDDRPVTTSGDERLAVEGGFQAAVVTCAGDEVRLGTAPDVETARSVVAGG